jgi:hypothetical protein
MGKKKLKKIIRIEVSLDPWCKICDCDPRYCRELHHSNAIDTVSTTITLQWQNTTWTNTQTQQRQLIISTNTNTTPNTTLTSTWIKHLPKVKVIECD